MRVTYVELNQLVTTAHAKVVLVLSSDVAENLEAMREHLDLGELVAREEALDSSRIDKLLVLEQVQQTDLLICRVSVAEIAGNSLDIINSVLNARTVEMKRVGERISDRVEDSEEHEHRNDRGQTAAHGLDAFLFIELVHFLLKKLAVVAVFLLELLLLFGKLCRTCHRFLLLDRERKQHKLDDDGKNYNCESEIFEDEEGSPKDPSESPSEILEYEH